MVVNQSAPNLKRGLTSKFWLLRNENHVKFTDECVMCTEKHFLVKRKCFQMD